MAKKKTTPVKAKSQAQVDTTDAPGSDTPTTPATTTATTAVDAAAAPSSSKVASEPVEGNDSKTEQEQQQQVHDILEDVVEVVNEDVNEDENDIESQPLLQEQEQEQQQFITTTHSRNPQRPPSLPPALVDSQSVIHNNTPKDSTPLKQSLGQSYGATSTSNAAVVGVDKANGSGSDSNSINGCSSRPITPPPIACKGVLITNEATKNKRKLIFVTILCLCFFAVEMVGGYFAKSLALMSDAFHLLSDVVSFMVSLIAIWLSEQPATKRHSFGYHRAEVLAALMSVFIIWILTAFLLMEAYERIQNPQSIDGLTMCIVASVGVGINIMY
ncbi:hypothetical protein BGZ65_010409, partial [Modicella reniformis]